MVSEPRSAARVAVIEAFYVAVARGDAEALGALVDDHFAGDATIDLPPSLPYGGQFTGAQRLRAMFTGMAGSDARIGPDAFELVSITGDGERVAAELSFDWYPPGKPDGVPSGALELWSFEDDKVSTIRAYYWDTAALAAASGRAPA